MMKRKGCGCLAWCTVAAAVLLVCAAIWCVYFFYPRWSGVSPVLSASGGMPLWVSVPDVPHFQQADPRWGADKLGATEETLADVGCAVSSAAMVLGSYGVDVTPQTLNRFLSEHSQGFTPQGWMYWEAAAEFDPALAGQLLPHYEDAPSYRMIDENLLAHNPVIARVRLPSGATHFVVIAGKQGKDYLMRDPLLQDSSVPLKAIGAEITGLRFYCKP